METTQTAGVARDQIEYDYYDKYSNDCPDNNVDYTKYDFAAKHEGQKQLENRDNRANYY